MEDNKVMKMLLDVGYGYTLYPQYMKNRGLNKH